MGSARWGFERNNRSASRGCGKEGRCGELRVVEQRSIPRSKRRESQRGGQRPVGLCRRQVAVAVVVLLVPELVQELVLRWCYTIVVNFRVDCACMRGCVGAAARAGAGARTPDTPDTISPRSPWKVRAGER